MRIVVSIAATNPAVGSHLKEIGGDDMVVVNDEAGLAAALPGAEVLICPDHVYSTDIAALVAASTSLKWMQLLTAGYDNVGRNGVPRGIALTNVGDAFSPSVAVHAVALLLALQRGIPTMLINQAGQDWNRTVNQKMVMPIGGTLLILGFGSIGREIARLMKPHGMTIIGINRSGRDSSGGSGSVADEVHAASALHTLLPRADAVIVAVPLGPATQKLIGARELALCKRTALIVNISRGAIIDQPALEAALRAGTIGGAGLDVTDPEPLPKDDPLWRAPNVIISPHVAGAAGPSGAKRQAAAAGDNLKRYLAGQPLQNVIKLD